MDQAIESKNIGNYTKHNESFHFLIYESAGAPLLLAMIRDLWVQVAPFFTSLFEGSDYLSKGNHWHKEILRSLENKDVEAVKAGLKGDIDTAGRDLHRILELSNEGH